jgi:hypothetical protein
MGYKPQAEFYYSCKTVKDPFGIERDEILPGLLQVQHQSSVRTHLFG